MIFSAQTRQMSAFLANLTGKEIVTLCIVVQVFFKGCERNAGNKTAI
jgi:hypothetical protein